jgi:hypothetical protein
MTEPRDRLSAAFTDLAVSLMSEVNLPGTEAARRTVRARRNRRLAVVSAAVAVVILAPGAIVALLRGPGAQTPDIGSTPTTSPASPSVSASTGPARLAVIADENDRRTPLDDALLPLPAFGQGDGCPEGETQYNAGAWQAGSIPTSEIWSVTAGDVDRDGTPDDVALISCAYGRIQGTSVSQLVAFTGDGPYALLGQVIVAEPNYSVAWPEVAEDGTVRALVSGPLEPVGAATHEWRTWRWDGSGFARVGTPEVVGAPSPTDLRLAVSPSTVSGPRTQFTVTVDNAGSTATDYLVLTFAAGALLSIRPEGFNAELRPLGCDTPAGCRWAARLEPMAPGQSASGRFIVTGLAAGESLSISVHGWVRGPGSVENRTSQNTTTIEWGG